MTIYHSSISVRGAAGRSGLTRDDYRGEPSTLCPGCGHNPIVSQIMAACYELGIAPEEIVKVSGIGCSSKAIAYFMSRSFGFNGLHGRMASLAIGVMFADTTLRVLGLSGDGDTVSIGMGGFKHLLRRNAPMTYIVANNGVYGLTKGQFSATADIGLNLKHQGTNPYMPVDICMEALASNATFVARSFAGDPKQVRELIKAALNHQGIAVLDVISPCVTFNNQENALHSYTWGKDHDAPLHEIAFVPPRAEIVFEEEFEENTVREVTLHDGSMIVLKKLGKDYNPTDRWQALRMMDEAQRKHWLITGLIYIDTSRPSMTDLYNLPDKPLNRLTPEELRPPRQTIDWVNGMMF